MEIACERIKSIVGEGENAGHQHFHLFFPHNISKSYSLSRVLEDLIVW